MTRSGRGLVAAVAISIGLAGCTAGAAETAAPTAKGAEAKGTVTLWHFFGGREAKAIAGVVQNFERDHPGIKVQVRESQDDEKMRQAISTGKGPDVGISSSTDIVGSFCSSGAFQDLGAYIKRDGVDLSQLNDTVKSYTEFDGVRCAMPLLADAYGFYYNKKLLKEAGFNAPPKTASELTKMAKALTKRSSDGTIEVAGFVPNFGFYENSPTNFMASFDAHYLKDDGSSAVGDDQGWKDMLTWQKDLVDWYGRENLTKFTAKAGQEFSAENAFEQGKIAMMVDGEWRNAFIADEAPDLEYGTAPMPVIDAKPDLYGAGYVTGTIAGISKGSKNPEAAWQLLRYLTLDTNAVVDLANSLKNVPSTQDAAKSPKLKADEHFTTFINVFNHPKSTTTPASKAGAAGYQDLMNDFVVKWQEGKVPDLNKGLNDLGKQIDVELQR
jgi:multiple sugar transport system substrate-binding protein